MPKDNELSSPDPIYSVLIDHAGVQLAPASMGTHYTQLTAFFFF
jgi:hypothetical protein